MIFAPASLSIVDKDCSTEFKCTSGQCVSAIMRCDGHPDCWDRSDEESCTNALVCTTKLRCPQSKECLLQEWRCDGDQDCKDGTDEKVAIEGKGHKFEPFLVVTHKAFRSKMNTIFVFCNVCGKLGVKEQLRINTEDKL